MAGRTPGSSRACSPHFFIVRGHVRDCVMTHELALDVAANDPPVARGDLQEPTRSPTGRLARYPEAVDHTQRAIELFRELGDVEGEAVTLSNLGLLYRNIGPHRRGRGRVRAGASRMAREIGSRTSSRKALGNISSVYRALGRLDEALAACTEAFALMRELGERRDEADTQAVSA